MVFAIGNRELQWFFNHIFQQILIFFCHEMTKLCNSKWDDTQYEQVLPRTSFKCFKSFWETKRLGFVTTRDVRISPINEVKDSYKFLK